MEMRVERERRAMTRVRKIERQTIIKCFNKLRNISCKYYFIFLHTYLKRKNGICKCLAHQMNDTFLWFDSYILSKRDRFWFTKMDMNECFERETEWYSHVIIVFNKIVSNCFQRFFITLRIWFNTKCNQSKANMKNIELFNRLFL